jgi:hypothetical protein
MLAKPVASFHVHNAEYPTTEGRKGELLVHVMTTTRSIAWDYGSNFTTTIGEGNLASDSN